MSAAATTETDLYQKNQASFRAEWWRCLFDQSEDAQFICTKTGSIIEINRKAAHLFGWIRQSDPLDCHLFQFLTAPAAKKVISILRAPRAQSETLPAITILSNGRLALLADLQVTPLGDQFAVLSIKDASRRWRLESHAQRLITAIDATPDVVFLTDANFKLTFANSSFQIVTGYTIEDALSQPADFLRDASCTGQIQQYTEAVRQGNDWRGELINRKNDGSLYPVEAIISPIFSNQGEFIGSVTFERDQTAQKKLQDDLLLERNFARSILNSLDSAVYTVDREFKLTHFNEAWKKMPEQHGWLKLATPPQAGRSLLDYIPDAHKRAELAGHFNGVLAEGTIRELRISSPGHHWLIHIIPWLHENQIRGLIYKVTDHTQLTELQNQLYQSQKMETIGALAAGVAHDFNNLLLAIRGNVSLLMLDAPPDSKNQGRLHQIEEASDQASSITQQLLSFSRSSDEQITILDFNQTLKDASEMARRSARGKIEIQVETASAPLKVRMDLTRAQQMLLNLCVNAQDAMPDGGILTLQAGAASISRIQAAKFQLPFPTDFVRCSVSDTGTGIPPEILPRIFDPFFTTKAKGKGTGLGLAIVHSVVSKAGGFLEVESSPGQGTVFHIYLPVAQEEVTTRALPRRNQIKRGSGRILVVDDLDLVHDFTRDFLQAAGYDVLVANSADGALEILEREGKSVDLLLTDYNMPYKNGWQLIQEAVPHWPHLKLVLASGYLDENERLQAETNHDIRILYKPYSISEATTLIAEMLAPLNPGLEESSLAEHPQP